MNCKILTLSAMIGVAAAFTSADARAMPLTHEMAAAVSDHVIAVRDGCGRGFRFSNYRGGCVPIDRGPRYNNDAAAAAAAAAVTLGVIGAVIGSGPRHHNRRNNAPRRHNRW